MIPPPLPRLGWIALWLCLAGGCLVAARAAETGSPRLRLLIETDAGGDPDDEQSLVRFLLYANEWDVEGIIANRPAARAGENRNRERTGLGIVRALIHAYGQCWTNLVRHDPRYPAPAGLLARTVPGYDDTEAGVNLILTAVDSPDPRPLWYSDWGSDHGSATNNLRRALDRVLRERGPEGYAKFKGRLRLASYDKFGEHTRTGPPWELWVNTWQPELEGRRWYHRFSALTATAGGFDLRRDVLTGHGPLGALYPANTTHPQKEGDTASFLYLVPTGMNDPQEPTWGSWAGRYGPREDNPGKPYYWANQTDAWNGITNRDHTLLRWAVHLQNDFRARLDWCVQPFAGANHPPQVTLNGHTGTDVLRLRAQPDETLTLDATGTRDPDGQSLHWEWFTYPEAGTYGRDVPLQLGPQNVARLTVPADAAGRTIHALVMVTDTGSPPLTRYRRAVIEVAAPSATPPGFGALFQPPPELSRNFGSYHSPLLFRDGTAVKTPADWARRRAELLREWHDFLGPWPPVLDQPRCDVLGTTNRGDLTQHRVRLEIAPGQTGEGWLLVPPGRGPFPAVLVVYYEPETSVGLNDKQPLRDFALQLAQRGFVTLSVGTPGGNAWKPELGSAQCQPLSFHAYVAANCWQALAHRPEVDAARIGVVGHSYGGKWALFAGALWDRFAAVAVSDPGIVFDETRPNVNYWEPWYLGADPVEKRPKAGVPTTDNPRTGAYRRLVAAGRDLHELHALIAPRPFFISGGSEDPVSRWTALNHTVAVNALLGATNRVGFSQRPSHDPTEESNAQVFAFFQESLSPGSPALKK